LAIIVQGKFSGMKKDISPEESKPLVTFAVISYNQERFIAEAVQSALDQTYSPLEIVISDDCSTDSTYNVIEEVVDRYKGPHKVILNRNHPNLGLAGNVNKVWTLATGELVVFQGGDDISLSHRTDRLVQTWLAHNPRPDLVYSGEKRIDEDGRVISDKFEVITTTPKIDRTVTGSKAFVAGGATAAYARNTHFFVGPLSLGIIAEDFVYSFRAMLGNGVVGIPEALILYRQHQGSILGELRAIKGTLSKKFLSGHLALLLEYKRAMDIYRVGTIYLRWRLNRRIKSTECELKMLDQPGHIELSKILWALATVRPRFLMVLLKKL
jgi:glycosyltransferase involved in cell wall biosynthesis